MSIKVNKLSEVDGRFIEWAVRMVEANVGQYYARWSHRRKRQELNTPGMLYFVYTADNDECAGFAAVLPDTEPNIDSNTRRTVLYIYEIQISKRFQGQGIGSKLIQAIFDHGRECAVQWVMLTHFRANHRACEFYSKHGFQIDWSSPDDGPYVILGKQLLIPAPP